MPDLLILEFSTAFDEGFGLGAGGTLENILGYTHLLDQTVADENDLVGNCASEFKLMSNNDHRSVAAFKILDYLQDLACQLGVERGRGLIEAKDLWREHQGSGDGNSLLLTSGEEAGVSVCFFRKACHRKDLVSLLVDLVVYLFFIFSV